MPQMTEFGKTPLMGKQELADAGVSMARPRPCHCAPAACAQQWHMHLTCHPGSALSFPPVRSPAVPRPPALWIPAQILYPLSAFRAQSRGAEQVFHAILGNGTNREAVQFMNTREETYQVIDYHCYERQLDAALTTED